MPTKTSQMSASNSKKRQKKFTTISLKVDYNKRIISTRFNTSFNVRTSNSNQCTCHEGEQYHVAPRKIANTDMQRLRFVFESDSDVRKMQSAIKKAESQMLEVQETGSEFHYLASQLKDVLARWCAGRIPQNHRWTDGNVEMRPFRASPLTSSSYVDHVLSKLQEALTENEVKDNGLGYIYILRSHNPTAQAELKIGFSRYHPQHRAQELGRCLIRPEVVAHTQLLPFAKRVEALVHVELDHCRKVQWCSWCHRNHQEWFTIAIDRARKTVARWSRFILLRPYPAGRLRDEMAKHFLSIGPSIMSSAELAPDSHWETMINSIPVDESRYSKIQQLGTYLNAIWMYRNIQDWTESAPAWKGVRPPNSFDDFYDGYLCSDETNEIRKALSIIDFETLRSIYFDENNPSRIPTSDAVRRVLFGERGGSSSKHFDLGYFCLPNTEAKTQRVAIEVVRILQQLNTTTTGARSVINPAPGTEDSPLGNATMIPVLGLLDLRDVSVPVQTSIGYDRTNMGFQLIQEAYRRGEWTDFPSFRKPISTRFFEILGKLSVYGLGSVGLLRLINML